jgi:hypothetical protein
MSKRQKYGEDAPVCATTIRPPSFESLGFELPPQISANTRRTLEYTRIGLPAMKAILEMLGSREMELIEEDFSPEELPLVRELYIRGGVPVAELEPTPGGEAQ